MVKSSLNQRLKQKVVPHRNAQSPAKISVSSTVQVQFYLQVEVVLCRLKVAISKTFQSALLNLNTARQIVFILSDLHRIRINLWTHKTGLNIEQERTMNQHREILNNKRMHQLLLRKNWLTSRVFLIPSSLLSLSAEQGKGSQSASSSTPLRPIKKSFCSRLSARSIRTQIKKNIKKLSRRRKRLSS